nr:hypothetical protein [Hyphomonas sp.]
MLSKTAGPAGHFSARLETDMPAGGFRETYYRAVMRRTDGTYSVTPLPDQDSSLLRPLQAANCLIRRQPNAPAANVGEDVECVGLT